MKRRAGIAFALRTTLAGLTALAIGITSVGIGSPSASAGTASASAARPPSSMVAVSRPAATAKTGNVSGRITNRFPDGVPVWDLPWISWDEKYDDGSWGCGSDDPAGVVTVTKIGSTFAHKDCISPRDGRFNVGRLPAGKYYVSVKLITPGLGGSRYLKKSGKRLVVTVKPGRTTSVGAHHLRETRATARGVVTVPTVPGGACAIALIDSSGKNRTADTKVRYKKTGAKTKVSYFVWAKSGARKRYAVRAQCTNNDYYYWDWIYDGGWFYSPRSLSHTKFEHPVTSYSGSATSRSKAKLTPMAAGTTKRVDFSIKKWLPAKVGKPTLTGTARPGKTLTVKVPGRVAKSGLAVAWYVGGILADFHYVRKPMEDGDDAYLYLYRFDKSSYTIKPADAGKRIRAKVLVWQSDHWSVQKRTTSVTVGSS